MRPAHGTGVPARVAATAEWAHLLAAVNWKGAEMFVRAVWRLRRLVDIRQTLREMDVPPTRDAFGLSGQDFQKMTRGLFDRQR